MEEKHKTLRQFNLKHESYQERKVTIDNGVLDQNTEE